VTRGCGVVPPTSASIPALGSIVRTCAATGATTIAAAAKAAVQVPDRTVAHRAIRILRIMKIVPTPNATP
jgi:tRNA G18 (ribose-2'-O)-methylase SpoU